MFGFDDALALANTKAGSALAGSIGNALGGGPTNITSGAPVDARSFMDGSGWTVSTGRGKATGGERQQQSDPSVWPSVATRADPAPMQAGLGGTTGIVVAVMVLAMIWKARQ